MRRFDTPSYLNDRLSACCILSHYSMESLIPPTRIGNNIVLNLIKKISIFCFKREGVALMFLKNDAKHIVLLFMSKTYVTLCTYVLRGKRLLSSGNFNGQQ